MKVHKWQAAVHTFKKERKENCLLVIIFFQCMHYNLLHNLSPSVCLSLSQSLLLSLSLPPSIAFTLSLCLPFFFFHYLSLSVYLSLSPSFSHCLYSFFSLTSYTGSRLSHQRKHCDRRTNMSHVRSTVKHLHGK